MDYMREINAFYDFAEVNDLSPSCVTLWHAFMFLANRARWPEQLTLPISALESRAKLKSTAVKEARKKLKELGLIDFEFRDGNQSTIYRIISICGRLTTANPPHITTYPTDTPHTKTNTSREGDGAPSQVSCVRVTNLDEVTADTRGPTGDRPSSGRKPSKPNAEEVAAYCASRGNKIDAAHFCDYYDKTGWRKGDSPIIDWRAAVREWERKGYEGMARAAPAHTPRLLTQQHYTQRDYTDEQLNKLNVHLTLVI